MCLCVCVYYVISILLPKVKVKVIKKVDLTSIILIVRRQVIKYFYKVIDVCI